MDFGAQGRPERFVFHADLVRLFSLRAETERRALRYDVDLVRVRFVVQTDAGDIAGCSFVA